MVGVPSKAHEVARGVSGQDEAAEGPAGSHRVAGGEGRCNHGEASVEAAHACRGGAWGLGDPWVTRNGALWAACPLGVVQGGACRGAGGAGAGLLTLGALDDDAVPSRVVRDAPAWGASLDDASRQVGKDVGEEGALHWEFPLKEDPGHLHLVAWVEAAWQEAFLGALLQVAAPVGETILGVGCLAGSRLAPRT